jgi:2'-5' RNA ligase
MCYNYKKRGGISMYVWIGINVNDQLLALRNEAKKIEDSIGFSTSCYTLPYHISLKISFAVDDNLYPSVVDDILTYYKKIKPFEIYIKGIENEQTISWIRMQDNDKLNQIHDDLNLLLLNKYGIPYHEYDLDYKFHTTLFMDSDSEKVMVAYNQIKEMELPNSLLVNKMLIGASKTGALGSFSVTHEVEIK